MVVVRFQEQGPWQREAAYYQSELHQMLCGCEACCGEGIDVAHGP